MPPQGEKRMQLCNSFICYVVNTSGIALLNSKNDTLFWSQQQLDFSYQQSNISDLKFWEAWPCSLSFRGPSNKIFFIIYGRLFEVAVGQDFKVREGKDMLQISAGGTLHELKVNDKNGELTSTTLAVRELTDQQKLRENQIHFEEYAKIRGQYESEDQMIAAHLGERERQLQKEKLLEELFGTVDRTKKPPKPYREQFATHLHNAKQNFVDMYGAIFYQNDKNNVQRKQLSTANSLIASYQKQIDVMKEQLEPVFADADAENQIIYEAYKGYKRQLDYLEKLIHDVKVAKQMVLSSESSEYTKAFYSYFDYSQYESML